MACSLKCAVYARSAAQRARGLSKGQNPFREPYVDGLDDVLPVPTDGRVLDEGQYVASYASRVFCSMRADRHSNAGRECMSRVPMRNCSQRSITRVYIAKLTNLLRRNVCHLHRSSMSSLAPTKGSTTTRRDNVRCFMQRVVKINDKLHPSQRR